MSIRKLNLDTPPLSAEVATFISTKKQMFINGEFVDSSSGEYITTYNPATGEKITEISSGTANDINNAVNAARKAFEVGLWTKMTASDRGRLLWRIGDLILENAAELAELESLDNGKSKDVAIVADVPLTADVFHYMAGWATKISGDTFQITAPAAPGNKFMASTLKEPVGVVGQIIPWNFPLLMAAWKLAPALTAGNCVVIKPSEITSLSLLRLAELMQKAGLPNGVVNIVTGYGTTVGSALAAHPGVDKIAFTGSTEVGKYIVNAARDNLKKVSLELGGKSPNIIFDDVEDIDKAIQGAANAIFFNHGQCCCAGSRLYVQRSIYQQVLDGVAHIANSIELGAGLNSKTDMGPVVSQAQLDKICGYLHEGKTCADIAAGGNTVGNNGYFVEPTVVTNTNPNLKLVNEEIFGPVVVVEPFDNINEIVQISNNTEYGLAAGIWTQNISKANKLATQLKAGTVWVNCYNVFDSAMPFGGYKQSGWGRELGKDVLDLYTQTKSVCISF